MKKFLFLLVSVLFCTAQTVSAQQLDTIVGWTFPVSDSSSLYADKGIVSNVGVCIIDAEDTAGEGRIISFTNGATTLAATASYWNDGANVKFWSIEFKATGYENLVLYSKQRAGNTNKGPVYFRVQYKISGGNWTDIPDTDTITCGNDWTTGVVDSVALPSDCNNITSSIYVRWIMISNDAYGGGTVDSLGISKIDDIFILGDATSGIPQNETADIVNIYPNPSNGIFTVEADVKLNYLAVYDILGKEVKRINNPSLNEFIDLSSMNKGLYIIRFSIDGEWFSEKLILK